MKKRASIVAVLGACLILGVAGSAFAGTKTKVTIKEQSGGFYGYVKSNKDKCSVSRVVALLKQKGNSPKLSRDKVISTDVAQANGDKYMWAISSSTKGKFYAYAPKISGCKAGRSKTI